MTNRRNLLVKLAKARQQFQRAQLRVTTLEAQVGTKQLSMPVCATYDYPILDNLLEGCQIIGFDWRYRYLNDSAACHAQRTKEELLGYTMMEQYPGIEHTDLFTVLQRCMQERLMEKIENEFFYPDGSTAWFELRVQPIHEGLIVFSVNITARKQAEAAERESADWARLTLAAGNLGKWQYNIETGVVRLDETARLHYGFAQDTVPLALVLEQLHPDDVARLGAEIAATLDPASDGRYATEYRVIHSDGSVHWLAVQAQVYFRAEGTARRAYTGFGTSQEITARKAAEEALKRYTQRLEILHEIDLGLISARSTVEIMATALKQVRTFFACEQAITLLFDRAANEVLIFSVEATAPSSLKEGDRYPMTPGFLDKFDDLQVSIIDDLQDLPTTNPTDRWVKQDGMRSSLRVLLTQQGRPLGMMVLNAAFPRYFKTEQQRRIAAQIANQLAIALHQRQLADDLAQYARTVEEMYQFLQATLDGFPANTAVLDPDGTILTVNHPWKCFADAHGAQPKDLYYLGDNYLTLCDTAVGPMAEEAAATAAGIRAVIAGEQDEFTLEYPCQTTTMHWFMLRVTPFAESSPRRVVVAHIDITERKITEETEREQRLLAEALRDSLAALTTSVDIDTTMHQILAYSATVIPSEAGKILLYEGSRGHVAYFRGHSPETEAFFRTNRISLETGLYPKLDDSQAYYLVADTQRTPEWHAFPVLAWVRSSMGVQIVVHGKPIGLLIADSATVGQFQQKDVENLQMFARYAALALEKAQYVDYLEQQVQARTVELQAAKERVEAILNNSADGILLVDTDLHIQQTNTSFNRLVGYVPATDENKALSDFIEARDAAAMTQRFHDITAEAPTGHLELQGRRQDGTVFDAELSIGLIKGDGIVCIMRDITNRKAQERQLRYHASLQKVVGDAVIVTDMALHILSWNKAAERIYGWSAAEVMGKLTSDVLRTQFSSTDERARHLAHLHTQGWWQAEVIQHHKAGDFRHILSSAALIYDEDGEPSSVVVVNHDITARKQAEDALQKAAMEIFDLYNNAPCGYHSLDQDGVFVQINDTELRWLRYERAEVVGKLKFTDLLVPESLSTFQQNFPLFQACGRINDLQFTLMRKDGSTIHVLLNATAIYDAHGRFLKSRSSLFDITKLRQAQQALISSESRYRLLAENITDVITKMNSAGIRIFITPSCYALLGYWPDELIGKPSFELVHPEDLPVVQAIVREALTIGRHSFSTTQRFCHKDGHYIWVEVTHTILRDPSTNEFVEMIGVIRDIAERKRTEAILMARMEEDHEFQSYLKALHEITIELTQLDDLDLFYRRTVELGLARLGFERLALFLYDAQAGGARGTYGTNAQGNVIDERHLTFTPDPTGTMQRAFVRTERFCFDENVPLYSDQQIVGLGWNGATVLWNGTQRLGWLVTDNLLSQKPASKPMLDTLGLYALTVGALLAQKQVQIALRTSENRYRLLAENISDVVVRTTVAGKFLYVSPSSRIVLGYEPAELMEQTAISYIHPDDLPMIELTLRKIGSQNRPDVSISVRIRHKQGYYVWLEIVIQMLFGPETGAIEGFVGSARNISDRKGAEAALKESEENYRRLVETMRGGLIVYDVADRLTYVNDRACEMVGYSRAEMLGTHLYDYVDTQTAQKLKAQMIQRRVQEVTPYELLINHKDGNPVHLLISGSPLVDKNGNYNGSLVVMTDITVQKQAEATLRLALDKEKELGELKSRFISMASHEFRTPLATILALAETLKAYRQRFSETQIEQKLDRIKEQVAHLKDIMEDVLLLAQMQARRAKFNPVDLDLDLLCRTILDEFQTRTEVKHQLTYRCGEGNYILNLDPKLMRQIISNLLSNAIKYSPAGKLVQVSLEFLEEMCVLQVCDEGIGIPDADLQHLFEPFHRAANVGAISGTGLGLVITKESVELHGGTITVESQLGRGTTFTIAIPILPQEGMEENKNSAAV